MDIDCVFFDYDGVLTTDATGSATTCRYLSARTGVPLERVQSAFARHNRALTLGQMTHEDVWPEICSAVGKALPPQALTDAFDSTPVNRLMFELAERLKAACRVAIITDNKLDRMHRLIAVQRLDELFDPIIVSAAHGCSKASGELFDRALATAGVLAAKTVFIDNDEKNVAAAAACGMHAIHFDHFRNDVAALADRLCRNFDLPV
ncbi:MAG: HAD-IA family hydrolase [Ramlibacter sp.]|nr:HAD-IA family hydrolase [Ramlibacter sp.]